MSATECDPDMSLILSNFKEAVKVWVKEYFDLEPNITIIIMLPKVIPFGVWSGNLILVC